MQYIQFVFPGIPNVRAVFTGRDPQGPDVDRQGNLSYTQARDADQVLANRLRLRRELGFRDWHSLRQVHGQAMVFDPSGSTLEARSTVEADGQATTTPGLALAVKTADCQPILLAHASGRYVCALHCGWRGNRAGFPTNATLAFCARYGLDPADLAAVRGPSLGPKASEFTNFDMEFGPEFEAYYDPLARTVDLWRLTRDQLLQAGIEPRNIHAIDTCTLTDPGSFSHRRDKSAGRQVGLIWIVE